MVEKTSDLDLSAVDKVGRSVVHHVVCPLQTGTYDSEEIVYVLSRAGARLDLADKAGETPLQLALKTGAVKLAARLQALLSVPQDKQVCQCSAWGGRAVCHFNDL